MDPCLSLVWNNLRTTPFWVSSTKLGNRPKPVWLAITMAQLHMGLRCVPHIMHITILVLNAVVFPVSWWMGWTNIKTLTSSKKVATATFLESLKELDIKIKCLPMVLVNLWHPRLFMFCETSLSCGCHAVKGSSEVFSWCHSNTSFNKV